MEEAMKRSELLEMSIGICATYKQNDLTPTVRQLYYRLVAGGHIPNADKQYKKLVATLADARKAGTFPMNYTEDRTRIVHEGEYSGHRLDVDKGLERAEQYLQAIPEWCIEAQRWVGQPKHVSAWVEKEALGNALDAACKDRKVSWFACKGYPSQPSLWKWMKKTEEECAVAAAMGSPYEEIVILYYGDHDPEGWNIPRSAVENIRHFAEVWGVVLPYVRMDRRAMLMEQIVALDAPPQVAKVDSSRYAKYVEEHNTTQCWELDAFDVMDFIQLIGEDIDEHFDTEIYEHWQQRATARRHDLIERMCAPGWLSGVFGLGVEDDDAW
jgi:hypothetical protein